MKLLLLEGDEELAAVLQDCLEADHHKVDRCRRGQDAILLGAGDAYQLLILDRMAEGIDGLGVLRALRAIGIHTPVLMLSTLGDVEDRIEGLEAGADDYLVKPFSLKELLVRLRVLARRPPGGNGSPQGRDGPVVVRVGDVEMDRLKRSVSRNGCLLDLQFQEFRLLEFLMIHADEIVTRAMLLEHVWSVRAQTKTNVIESHMSRLRIKLCAHGGGDPIRTVRGAGYCFSPV